METICLICVINERQMNIPSGTDTFTIYAFTGNQSSSQFSIHNRIWQSSNKWKKSCAEFDVFACCVKCLCMLYSFFLLGSFFVVIWRYADKKFRQNKFSNMKNKFKIAFYIMHIHIYILWYYLMFLFSSSSASTSLPLSLYLSLSLSVYLVYLFSFCCK